MTTEVRPLPSEGATPQATPIETESRVSVASQWKLMWWKFRKHRLAVAGGIVTLLIYLIALFAEFLAPFNTEMFSATYTYAPPQPLRLFEQTESGRRFNPHVNGYKVEIDQAALRRTFVVDEETKYEVGFFVEGTPYKWLGFLETNIHLIGPKDPTAPMYLLGADRLGRDVLSRLIYGTRISMSIGLVGVPSALCWGFCWAASLAFTGAQSTILSSGSSNLSARSPPSRCGWAWPPRCPPTGRRCGSILASP
jgi:peptide/nickel transport system permease protein